MIVSVGINIDNKQIRCLIYKNGSREFEKFCKEDMVSALRGKSSYNQEDLISDCQPKVDNLVALLDAQSEDDIKAIFKPFACPPTVKYIDGRVMIGRERFRKDLEAIFIGHFEKILDKMKNSVKDAGNDVDFHITMTYPGYLSDTVRDKLQSLMEIAINSFYEKCKSEREEEKERRGCDVKIGSISYMTEEEAIVFGHLYTTHSLDHHFSESPFIVCNVGDIGSSITRVPYKSAGDVVCEVNRIDRSLGKDLLTECMGRGVETEDLLEKAKSNPTTIAKFRKGLPQSITKELCDTVVRTFSECLANGLTQWIENGICDGIFVMGNSILFEDIVKGIKAQFPGHSDKFAELPFSQKTDDGKIDEKMSTLCALLYRTAFVIAFDV